MPAKVLFIGLDSAESSLLERWAAEGKLEAMGRLYEQGAVYRLENCWGNLPTAVWPELTTGRSPAKLGLLFPHGQLRTGEAVPRPIEAAEVDPAGFWTIAAGAGKRVAAVDLPWTVPPQNLNGIFLSEWGTHDRWFGTGSVPGTLVDEIRERHGEYPVRFCDSDYGETLAERERLASDVLKAVDYETRLLLDLIGRDEWDLFACAFGQFQCAGHNFWGFMDAQESASDLLRGTMLEVASKVDEGIAALREAAGSEAVTVVVASHGMGPLLGGRHLLPEVIVRLGAGSGKGSAAEIRSRLPLGVREIIRKLVPGSLRRRLQKAAGSLPAPLESSETRAVALPSDPNGYIRLNLKGREPNGSVEPGAEAEAELAEIRHQLFELKDPASGEKIVAEATTADEAFGAGRHPDLPDLMVRFRDDLGTIEACESERVGLLKIPFRIAHRTGDHNGTATLWLAGKRIEPTESPGSANALDVAPTILSLLDVPIPAGLDGNPVDESKRRGLTGAPRS